MKPRMLILPGVVTAVALVTLFADRLVDPALAVKPDRSYAGELPAPDFPVDLDWLNTGGRALDLPSLRGKVVLLDFWTYGCINCFHIIPDLERLEHKYPKELVVIGVHSAKFANEGRTSKIRSIVARYGLRHPVVNDREMQIWRAYGANAWPTLALIDPVGNYVGSVAGEGHYDLLDTVIGGLIQEFGPDGGIDRTPLDLQIEDEAVNAGMLRFPGKVLADLVGGRLFIADSNNHRILVTDLEGRIQASIGAQAGYADGDFENARFSYPQGLALAGPDTLYIADTRNNVIRIVDLAERKVDTAVGTGERAYQTALKGPASETALNTPWGLLWHEDLLYIAMAGQHQIWVYEPAESEVRVFAGSRREELRDGRLRSAGLNQPSGLATDGERLFIADSEASAIRVADLDPDGSLDTIVGVGLFDFGDVDGAGDEVRLQHPLGVAWHGGALYVADTYNSKIKRVDPESKQSQTFLGEEAGLDEPGGLSISGDNLYIADTNNSRILQVRLEDGESRVVRIREGD